MNGIEGVLGMSYRDLGASEFFHGIEVPGRERIEDRSYVRMASAGISLVLRDHETVEAIQLHARGHEGLKGYEHDLPAGLMFGMLRSDVRRMLGEPREHGEERTVSVLGKKPAWDSFIVGEIQVHVEYTSAGGGVQLVTITRK